MTALLQAMTGGQHTVPGNFPTGKILVSYLASYLTALTVIGLFYFLGLFGSGLFAADSPVMQVLNR